ncbi:hypothetical protein SAMN05216374_3169 [Tardiphaga sp. OK246]|nr:hypothetical protein SAMN05216374_3169 [Tardiphaga sp. OK246]
MLRIDLVVRVVSDLRIAYLTYRPMNACTTRPLCVRSIAAIDEPIMRSVLAPSASR